MLIAKPSGNSGDGGYTSISFAVKSVSTADDDAQSRIRTGPVISTASFSGAVWNVRTSSRAFSGCRSVVP